MVCIVRKKSCKCTNDRDEGKINDLLEVTNEKGKVTKENANMHVMIVGDLDVKKRMK